MTDEAHQIQAALEALQAQRGLLGDALADAAIAPLRARLAALQAVPDATLLLRQASVLFVDVVGSTAWAQRLDAEDLHALVSASLARLAVLVQQHQGRVLRYTGDGMKVVFGADAVQEDDPERAVHCGLALLADARAQAQQLRQQHAWLDFQVRVGIHSGPVALGAGLEGRDTAVGSVVHLAARMEQTAPPGGLRISQATWRLVQGLFDVAAQPPLIVKGVADAMPTWLVRAARPRATRLPARGIDGLHTPLVGRDAQLAQLQAAVQSLSGSDNDSGSDSDSDSGRGRGRMQATTVLGDAGLGKSRLLAELLAWLARQPQPVCLLRGRALPGSQLQPHALLRDVLMARFQIPDSHSAAQARSTFTAAVSALFADAPAPERAAQVLGQLIGLDFSSSPQLIGLLGDPRALRDQAFDIGTALLQRLAAADGAPLLLVLDDLQWADEGSLDFLAHLLAQPQFGMLLALARPALLVRRPHWCSHSTPAHRRLDLLPLDAQHSLALACALLRRLAHTPPALLAQLTGRAEGNPFYMEELTRMLIDERVIEVVEVYDAGGVGDVGDVGGAGGAGDVGGVGEGTWQLHLDRLQARQLPATLTGVLQARLDSLAPAERLALQHAAVIGTEFWDQALEHLLPGSRSMLPALMHKGLVVRSAGLSDTSAFAGSTRLRFGHALLQQAAYDTLRRAQRQAAHAATAAWLQQHLGERADEVLALVAEHQQQAGDHDAALASFERAAMAATARFAHASALAQVERALANPRLADAHQRWRLLARATALADLLGDQPRQARAIEAREAITEQLDDNALRADLLLDRSLLADRRGETGSALARGQALADFAMQHGLARHAAMALGNVAWQQMGQGALQAAQATAAKALYWAARQADAKVRAQLSLVAFAIDNQRGDKAGQAAHLAQARTWSQGLNTEPRLQSSVLEASTALAIGLGDGAQAVQHGQAALQLTEANAMASRLPAVLCTLSEACLLHGDATQALAHSSRALAMLQSAPDTLNTVCPVLLQHGQALAALGRPADALHHTARALALRTAQGHASGVRECLALMAGQHLAAGDRQQALRTADQALAHDGGVPHNQTETERPSLLRLQQVLAALHDPRAAALLAQDHRKELRRS